MTKAGNGPKRPRWPGLAASFCPGRAIQVFLERKNGLETQERPRGIQTAAALVAVRPADSAPGKSLGRQHYFEALQYLDTTGAAGPPNLYVRPMRPVCSVSLSR